MTESPMARWFSVLERQQLKWVLPFIVLLSGTIVRWAVALNPYSGYNNPPMFGDYEAQRHWMEITIHLPTSQWYTYDLQWWGLDYPPLTAFHSWLCGSIGSLLNPEWFALDKSRGFESPDSKFFMRSTVFFSEFIVYVPAVYQFCQIRYSDQKDKMFAFLLILLQPALIMIDYGHFQFNGVMLGFALWAINFFLTEYYILGSVAFCLSLGFKQMALYYAPTVFAFLLGRCFQKPTMYERLLLFSKLGVTVIATMTLLFSPWLSSMDLLAQTIHRIFPLARGLYEDKVANVWCAINVVIKLRNILSLKAAVRLSLCATLTAILPINIHLGYQSSQHRFKYALVNTSLAFFLLSFQVHEKSILLPLMPATLLVQEEGNAVTLFTNIAMFSMYPLLRREGLVLPYFATMLIWNWMMGYWDRLGSMPTSERLVHLAALTSVAAWHIAEFTIEPPPRWPDLFTVINAVLSCGFFVLLLSYFTYRQFAPQEKIKKQ